MEQTVYLWTAQVVNMHPLFALVVASTAQHAQSDARAYFVEYLGEGPLDFTHEEVMGVGFDLSANIYKQMPVRTREAAATVIQKMAFLHFAQSPYFLGDMGCQLLRQKILAAVLNRITAHEEDVIISSMLVSR